MKMHALEMMTLPDQGPPVSVIQATHIPPQSTLTQLYLMDPAMVRTVPDRTVH
jgi:hypothetical protein